MKSTLTILFALLVLGNIYAQPYVKEIKSFQKELNKSYKSKHDSPLEESDRKQFKKHPFFEINEEYQVVATFQKEENFVSFEMQTSTDRKPIYVKYGTASFELKGETYTLSIYQSEALQYSEALASYLFLPFTDLTSGEETYGGGRYIDLTIPEGNEIIIDFNKAYHPYCAYNHAYSCPIPPKENFLNTRIEAGIKL